MPKRQIRSSQYGTRASGSEDVTHHFKRVDNTNHIQNKHHPGRRENFEEDSLPPPLGSF
ncbi:MAG: hypothetical protein AAF717_10010 [Bacteroidota bacterium]